MPARQRKAEPLRPRLALLATWLAIAAAVPAAGAGCADTSSCLAEIEAAQRETRTIEAHFVQTKHLSLLTGPLVSRGRFAFRRPDRVLWQTEEPQQATVLIDAEGIHLPGLDEADRQALAMAPIGTMFSQLGAIFTGSARDLEASFEVSASDEGDAIHLRLVPRREAFKRMFTRIDIRFARPALLVRDIELSDPLGDRVQIQMENARRNVDLPESTFARPR